MSTLTKIQISKLTATYVKLERHQTETVKKANSIIVLKVKDQCGKKNLNDESKFEI